MAGGAARKGIKIRIYPLSKEKCFPYICPMSPKSNASVILLLITTFSFAQTTESASKDTRWFKGMYLQYGYSRYAFSKSDLHFSNGNQYNFTVHKAVAHDRNNFDGLLHQPWQFTIPQYNYRIGFYLNKAKTASVEINYDHAKYVVDDYQRLEVSGNIGSRKMDVDTLIDPQAFMHLEHTNGANFYQVNYVRSFFFGGGKNYKAFAVTLKAGAGIVVPKTDVTLFGTRLDNKFKVAGYVTSFEPCFRAYPLRRWFLELSGKGGYANYLNASTIAGGKVSHHFTFLGTVLTVGFDIPY